MNKMHGEIFDYNKYPITFIKIIPCLNTFGLMKVSGFTFIRNAVKNDYPIVEAITSILPLCDEFIVMAGNSDDGTRELIEAIGSPKIKIIDSVWDDSLKEGGRVFAAETDKA